MTVTAGLYSVGSIVRAETPCKALIQVLAVHVTGETGHHEAPESLAAQWLLERVAHPRDTTSRS